MLSFRLYILNDNEPFHYHSFRSFHFISSPFISLPLGQQLRAEYFNEASSLEHQEIRWCVWLSSSLFAFSVGILETRAGGLAAARDDQ